MLGDEKGGREVGGGEKVGRAEVETSMKACIVDEGGRTEEGVEERLI